MSFFVLLKTKRNRTRTPGPDQVQVTTGQVRQRQGEGQARQQQGTAKGRARQGRVGAEGRGGRERAAKERASVHPRASSERRKQGLGGSDTDVDVFGWCCLLKTSKATTLQHVRVHVPSCAGVSLARGTACPPPPWSSCAKPRPSTRASCPTRAWPFGNMLGKERWNRGPAELTNTKRRNTIQLRRI